jgi:hypothetical protein
LGPQAGLQLYAKPMAAWQINAAGIVEQQADKNIWSMPEYMHSLAMDARHDFFAAELWEFPEGKGKGKVKGKGKGKVTGVLREEVKGWPMHSSLPDLDNVGYEFQPLAEDWFCFWRYYWSLIQVHEGEVRLVEGGLWKYYPTPPPRDHTFWHCQYAAPGAQRRLFEKLECRGAPQARNAPTHAWGTRPELTQWQIDEIEVSGKTTMCEFMIREGQVSHWRRQGIVMTFPHLLVWLVKKAGPVSLATAETWWKSQEIICYQKARGVKKEGR